ncbi:MAG: phosphoribosylanthranilate isomerase [Desulfuromonadales bacterium]
MIRVKICGITALEDARQAIECDADALGFVFYPPSPRCIEPALARAIISELPPFVTTVGLFVNEDRRRIHEIVGHCRLDAVQLHGDETPADCMDLPVKAVKALRVRDSASLDRCEDFAASALLLDAYVPGRYGGTGQAFDWGLVAEVAARRNLILAGGLGPENVSEAVETVRPYAVDVSSGVEIAPGRKDPERVAAFIRNAKGVFRS